MTMTPETVAAAKGQFHDLLPGVWVATTTNAPYRDHLITFFPHGAFLIHNPTNVEQGADLSGINDSVGMGEWRRRRTGLAPIHEYTAQFVQLNAHADTHQPAPGLRVALRLFIDPNQPDTFVGNAIAVFGDGPDQPTDIRGDRFRFDEDLMRRVP
jgi:hypothetical protein